MEYRIPTRFGLMKYQMSEFQRVAEHHAASVN